MKTDSATCKRLLWWFKHLKMGTSSSLQGEEELSLAKYTVCQLPWNAFNFSELNQLPVLCWHRGLVHRLRVLGGLKLSLPRGLLVALCLSRSWSDEVSWFKWFGLNATVPQPPREDPRRTARQLRSRGLHPSPSPQLPFAAPPLPRCIFDAQNLKCAKYINKVYIYI